MLIAPVPVHFVCVCIYVTAWVCVLDTWYVDPHGN